MERDLYEIFKVILYANYLKLNNEKVFKKKLHFITKNKKKMTGNVSVSTSPKYKLKEIKDLSKKLGITINDLIMCALSTSVK